MGSARCGAPRSWTQTVALGKAADARVVQVDVRDDDVGEVFRPQPQFLQTFNHRGQRGGGAGFDEPGLVRLEEVRRSDLSALRHHGVDGDGPRRDIERLGH